MRREEAAPEPVAGPNLPAVFMQRNAIGDFAAAPEPAGPDLPVVGDFAVAPEEEVE
jgi:hypothetical protein